MPAPSSSWKKSPVVFVADDEQALCELISHSIQTLEGCRVVTAHDGRTAQDLIIAEGPESVTLLISDLYMPRMRGDDLATWLHTKNPLAKVILISSVPDAARVDGDVDFLKKPFRIEELLDRVHRAISGESQARNG